jgi:hypothetical protein
MVLTLTIYLIVFWFVLVGSTFQIVADKIIVLNWSGMRRMLTVSNLFWRNEEILVETSVLPYHDIIPEF